MGSQKRDKVTHLSAMERSFVELRRAHPTEPGHAIAKRAGYTGSLQQLKLAAQRLMKRPAVSRALFAPRSRKEALRARTVTEMTDAELGAEIKQIWLDIARSSGASPSDRTRAATKLGETIQKFFVPIQVDTKTTLGMEEIVRAMGGAPPEKQEEVTH